MIAIINYGLGNLHSIQNMLRRAGTDTVISAFSLQRGIGGAQLRLLKHRAPHNLRISPNDHPILEMTRKRCLKELDEIISLFAEHGIEVSDNAVLDVSGGPGSFTHIIIRKEIKEKAWETLVTKYELASVEEIQSLFDLHSTLGRLHHLCEVRDLFKSGAPRTLDTWSNWTLAR